MPVSLVVGGSGKVGASVAEAVLRLSDALQLRIGGRNPVTAEAVCARLGLFPCSPDFFNTNMRLLNRYFKERLRDRGLVDSIVRRQEGGIRFIDQFVGTGIAMRIRVSSVDMPAYERAAEAENAKRWFWQAGVTGEEMAVGAGHSGKFLTAKYYCDPRWAPRAMLWL